MPDKSTENSFVTSLRCVIFSTLFGGGGVQRSWRGISAVLGVQKGGGIYLFWEVFREGGDARNWGIFALILILHFGGGGECNCNK